MAHSEFSESQFVVGYLSEYFRRMPSWYRPRFFLPTTSTEPIYGSDFIIETLTGIDFIQFKRSESMSRRGRAEMSAGVPNSYRPYYRFKIYNSGMYPQFDRLRNIASINPRFKVYYCAPMFHTNNEFHHHFYNNTIIDNSAIIDCRTFTSSNYYPPYFDINNGIHYLVFNNSNTGYLCSKAKEFNFNLTSEYLEPTENIIEIKTIIMDLFMTLVELDKLFIPKGIVFEKLESIQMLQMISTHLTIKYDINLIIY